MNDTVAILGPGAVGGALAVHLAAAGVDTVCIPRKDMAGILALSGLSLEVDGGEPLGARVEVREELTQPVRVLLVTVKAYQLEEALEQVDPAAVADGVVIPLLNGLEHVDTVRERLGPRVAAGTISRFEAHRVGRVQIIQKSQSALVSIASSDLPLDELESVARLLDRGAFEVLIGESEKHVLWDKAARLAVLAAATSYSHRTLGELLDDRAWRSVLEDALDEACAIAVADGVMLLPSTQWAIIRELDDDLTTSTARDVEAGRPSELDAITGSVVRAGERLGVPCPALAELFENASAHIVSEPE
ncbi:MAG: ketopantoate reductase family protein [Actinobacteria bacterium]|nr:ketopantoate reductase family protein [Actinomycetota bacterium]